MRKNIIVWGGYSLLIVILLVAIFFAGQALAKPETTHAQEMVNEIIPNSPNSTDAEFYCGGINNVAVFENRIHIRCNNANGSISYYSYATDSTNVATANQLLAIANTAFALGKNVWVFYYPSSSYNPTGCYTSDCRGLIGISMLQ